MLAGKGQRKRARIASDSGDGAGFRRRLTELSVRRRASDNTWELVHPRCARERTEDLDEVRKMLEAGEADVAIDELRWLLNGCSDCVLAHKLLGELATAEGDYRLARGHFGYAYEIGLSALPPEGLKGTLPYRLPANQAFLEAAKGLALCLRELNKPRMALRVLGELLKLDPSDPLKVGPWKEELRKGKAEKGGQESKVRSQETQAEGRCSDAEEAPGR
jgi:tetratricopeptide (TPR) repeat protein